MNNATLNAFHVERSRLIARYDAAVEQLREARIALDNAGIEYEWDMSRFEEEFDLPPGLLRGELSLERVKESVDRWHGEGTFDAMTKGDDD
jgi:hypothetical protein